MPEPFGGASPSTPRTPLPMHLVVSSAAHKQGEREGGREGGREEWGGGREEGEDRLARESM